MSIRYDFNYHTDEDGEKWIYPLTSIMGIEALNNESN